MAAPPVGVNRLTVDGAVGPRQAVVTVLGRVLTLATLQSDWLQPPRRPIEERRQHVGLVRAHHAVGVRLQRVGVGTLQAQVTKFP